MLVLQPHLYVEYTVGERGRGRWAAESAWIPGWTASADTLEEVRIQARRKLTALGYVIVDWKLNGDRDEFTVVPLSNEP